MFQDVRRVDLFNAPVFEGQMVEVSSDVSAIKVHVYVARPEVFAATYVDLHGQALTPEPSLDRHLSASLEFNFALIDAPYKENQRR